MKFLVDECLSPDITKLAHAAAMVIRLMLFGSDALKPPDP
jgi:hypothetical protein